MGVRRSLSGSMTGKILRRERIGSRSRVHCANSSVVQTCASFVAVSRYDAAEKSANSSSCRPAEGVPSQMAAAGISRFAREAADFLARSKRDVVAATRKYGKNAYVMLRE